MQRCSVKSLQNCTHFLRRVCPKTILLHCHTTAFVIVYCVQEIAFTELLPPKYKH